MPVFSYPDTVCPINNFHYWTFDTVHPNDIHHDKMCHDFTAKLITMALVELGNSDLRSTPFDNELPVPLQQIRDWDAYVYDPSTNTKLEM